MTQLPSTAADSPHGRWIADLAPGLVPTALARAAAQDPRRPRSFRLRRLCPSAQRARRANLHDLTALGTDDPEEPVLPVFTVEDLWLDARGQSGGIGQDPNLDEYFLGYRQAEQERLQQQAEQLADDSGWLFDRIGVSPAAHVVEIGCGPRGSQDASVYIVRLEAGAEFIHPLGEARGPYVYLIDGAASLDDEEVSTGDAVKVTGQPELVIRVVGQFQNDPLPSSEPGRRAN